MLPLVGTEHIHELGDNGDGTVTVELDPGTQIDLGAIGKGYASDRVAAIFREYEIPRGLLRLGGSVLAIGDRPDGEAWRVGIQDPKEPRQCRRPCRCIEPNRRLRRHFRQLSAVF